MRSPELGSSWKLQSQFWAVGSAVGLGLKLPALSLTYGPRDLGQIISDPFEPVSNVFSLISKMLHRMVEKNQAIK